MGFLIMMGVAVLMLWFSILYPKRISKWRQPWDRWIKIEPQWTGHVPLIGPIIVAVILTVIYILMIIDFFTK